VSWWRTDSDVLANTGDGRALPLGELKVKRLRGVSGDGVSLARSVDGGSLVIRAMFPVARFTFVGFLRIRHRLAWPRTASPSSCCCIASCKKA